jgi:hypothetical protein
MKHRIEQQLHLEQIVRALDASATVRYEFDSGDFLIRAPEHLDISLPSEFLDDHDDSEVSAAIMAKWGN